MDLKKELLEFVEANNWFSLEGRKNAEGVIDSYLKSYNKQLNIPLVSNCTTFSNRKFIRPVFDGISTVVTQYQVVDELGQFWFQGTKEDCEQFLYSC